MAAVQWWVAQVSANSNSVTVTDNPNNPLIVLGPYATKAEAQSAAKGVHFGANEGQVIGAGLGAAASGLVNNPLNPSPGAIVTGENAGSAAESGLTGFLSWLEQASTWVRILKVVVGGALILLGINKLTGTSTKLEQIVSKVPIPV
jgi:hypothetical protein